MGLPRVIRERIGAIGGIEGNEVEENASAADTVLRPIYIPML